MNEEPLMKARSPRAAAHVWSGVCPSGGDPPRPLDLAGVHLPSFFIFFPFLSPDRFSVLWLLIKCQEVAPEV